MFRAVLLHLHPNSPLCRVAASFIEVSRRGRFKLSQNRVSHLVRLPKIELIDLNASFEDSPNLIT